MFDSFHKKAVFIRIAIILIFVFSNSFFFCVIKASENNNDWQIMLSFNEPEGSNDYLVFGEKIDASDDKDKFDLPKPPAPQSPYIYSWFVTSLDTPYDVLWMDYKKLSDDDKIWNFTIIWSSDKSLPTDITISWELSEVSASGYDTFDLLVPNRIDMTKETSYQFTADINEPYSFQISLENKTQKDISSTNEQTFLLYLIFIIMIIAIVAIVIYVKKIKK